MNRSLVLYNTLSRQKEAFEPIAPPFVGLYVCGPTVYGEAHLGHARSAISFDILFRLLKFSGYKVRYVRNITDVGHLEQDADSGEDKIAKKARLEKLEPMEIVRLYTDYYHEAMDKLHVLRPSIEPTATGHIPEQIKLTETILAKGFGYVKGGSVYFDVQKYAAQHHYGILSGRKIEDLIAGTRELEGQSEKNSSLDFALWKSASPEHIMRWESPWGAGFPGWHLECTAMSTKYLGDYFDIHGGGMDLQFPHHECEIAQALAGHGRQPARYWLHNNMITINGQKMGKSLGNFITLDQLFTGQHPLLQRAYSPMTIRFFILQAHYRSTLDFSNDALKAAHKAYLKLMNGLSALAELEPNNGESLDETLDKEVKELTEACYQGLYDDLNTAVSLAALFQLLKKINAFQSRSLDSKALSADTFEFMKHTYTTLLQDIMGLYEEDTTDAKPFVEGMLDIYREAKEQKAYDKVDRIRALFKANGLVIKDSKIGVSWAYDDQ
jgi:cysteinyl-tRNA synthetase